MKTKLFIQTVLLAMLLPYSLSAMSHTDGEHLTEKDIIRIVDDRIALHDRQSRKKRLQSVSEQYTLAPKTKTSKLRYGDEKSRITIIEFLDTDCGYCRSMHPNLKQVVDYSKGTVNWVINHYPLQRHEPVASIKAETVECVRDNYDNKTAWSILDRLMSHEGDAIKTKSDVAAFVRKYGLNGSLINNCVLSGEFSERIASDIQIGNKKGVSSTPSIAIIDNQSGATTTIKGLLTPEQIATAITKVLEHGNKQL